MLCIDPNERISLKDALKTDFINFYETSEENFIDMDEEILHEKNLHISKFLE